MQLERVLMTPERAKQMLENLHPGQRRASRDAVASIAADIRAGRWVLQPQPVQIDEDGWTIDGQHRLLAIAQTGIAVELYLATNVPRAALGKIDTGKTRSQADVSKIVGRDDGTHRLALAQAAFAYLKSGKRIPIEEKFAFLDRNAGLVEAVVGWTSSDPHRVRVQTGGFRLCLLLLEQATGRAEEFCRAVRYGENLERGNPAMAYRTAIHQAMSHTGAVGSSMPFEAGLMAAHKFAIGADCRLIRASTGLQPARNYFGEAAARLMGEAQP